MKKMSAFFGVTATLVLMVTNVAFANTASPEIRFTSCC